MSSATLRLPSIGLRLKRPTSLFDRVDQVLHPSCVMAKIEAYAVADVEKLKATDLKLIHKKLGTLPQGLETLTSLTSLDLSDNPLTDQVLDAAAKLPASLRTVSLTGCQLTSIPACLARITGLQQVQLSANNINQADGLWACRNLLQASLGFNHINCLASKKSSSSSSSSMPLCSSPLMVLDLGHNDVADLAALLAELKQLSRLQSLNLAGNPVSMLPDYRDTVLKQLPQLLYLDGQRLISNFGAPCLEPGAAEGPSACQQIGDKTAPAAASTGVKIANDDAVQRCIPLLLELSNLQITEPTDKVFATLAAASATKQQQLQQQQQQQQEEKCTTSISHSGLQSKDAQLQCTDRAAAAALSGAIDLLQSPGTDVAIPVAPLRPIMYCLELTDPDGADMCSLPLTVAPPAPAAPEVMDQQQQQAAPAPAAGADARKGTKGRLVKQDSKAHGAVPTAAAGAAAKARPGSSTARCSAARRSSAHDGSALAPAAAGGGSTAAALLAGQLKVLLQLPVNVTGRDFLREGFKLRLMRMTFEPEGIMPQPAAASAALLTAAVAAAMAPVAAAAPKPAGGKAAAAKSDNKAGTAAVAAQSLPDAPKSTWLYGLKRQVVGTARVSGAELLSTCSSSSNSSSSSGSSSCGTSSCRERQQRSAEGMVELMPPAPLFDPVTGVRLALKDPTAKAVAPAGSCRFRLVLHPPAMA